MCYYSLRSLDKVSHVFPIVVQQLLSQYGFDKMITQINYQGKTNISLILIFLNLPGANIPDSPKNFSFALFFPNVIICSLFFH